MSPGVIQVRADICHDCPAPCAWQRDATAHADPCAACPSRRWGQWDCGSASAAPVPPSGDPPLPAPSGSLSPLLRRLRTYRRAGSLVGLLEFMRRRDACRHCPQARTLPTHPGLYGCGSCSTCTGGPERMLVPSSRCALGKWPVS